MSDEKRVLVTGAAGFIGSHLSERLLGQGYAVTGLDNFDGYYSREVKEGHAERLRAQGMELVEGDICDAKGMAGVMRRVRPGVVYHIAALAGVRPSILEPGRYARVNVEGVVKVLEAMKGAGCRRMVFASSSSVYGNNVKAPFSEDDSVNEPISPYAATKRAGELMCSLYTRTDGLQIAALRFFTVYGPRQRPDLAIAKFMKKIAEGERIEVYGDGTTARDYTYIDDIINGVTAAGGKVREQGESGGGWWRIYNLGGSKPVLLREMIETIERVVGQRAEVERKEMQAGDVERTYADIRRAASELGYKAEVGFEEGVRRQWEWMQEQGMQRRASVRLA